MLASGSTEFESRIVSGHFSYLKQLTSDGMVILAGRQNTDNSSFGIVLFNAGTVEEAREIMLSDPAVKNKVFRAELFPTKWPCSALTTQNRAITHLTQSNDI